jgi:ABC-type nickel/cobalt efflux system permease component RcnA
MCPICWINGILFLLFGASALSFGTEWYILIPSFVLLAYGGYKIWDGIKKGKNFTVEQKANNKRTITRFVIGVAIGLYTGIAVMYTLSSAEHQRMHDLLEQHGIEEHEHY